MKIISFKWSSTFKLTVIVCLFGKITEANLFFNCRFFLATCRACLRWLPLNTSFSCVRIKSRCVLSTAAEMLQVHLSTCPTSAASHTSVCHVLWRLSWRSLSGEVTATADDCIHTVPFQFDLMKLLPKCQQIELFFYTFGWGTSRSPELSTLHKL